MPRAPALLLALLLAAAACGDDPAAPDPGLRDCFALRMIDVPSTISGASQVFRMSLHNRSADTLRLRPQHPSTGFDFEVRRPGGPLLWHRNDGHVEIDQPWDVVLPPDHEFVFSHLWKLGDDDGRRLPPDDYEVRGRLALVEPTDTVWTRPLRFRLE